MQLHSDYVLYTMYSINKHEMRVECVGGGELINVFPGSVANGILLLLFTPNINV